MRNVGEKVRRVLPCCLIQVCRSSDDIPKSPQYYGPVNLLFVVARKWNKELFCLLWLSVACAGAAVAEEAQVDASDISFRPGTNVEERQLVQEKFRETLTVLGKIEKKICFNNYVSQAWILIGKPLPSTYVRFCVNASVSNEPGFKPL